MIVNLPLIVLILFVCECSSFVFVRSSLKTAWKIQALHADSLQKHDVITEVVRHGDKSVADNEVPRLYQDSDELIKWVERYGGTITADITVAKDGWSLSAQASVSANTALVRIPKKLCIYANPVHMGTPLLESTALLMNSLGIAQWRARLAIAVLSERVRPESFFSPYIRNLPFEFWGMPLFYTTSELRLTQDYSVLQRTRNRIHFLSEFTTTVLSPLQKTPMDPFSGNIADVNALAWGFAAASSRALRDIPSASSTHHIDKSSASIIDTTATSDSVLSESGACTSTDAMLDGGSNNVNADTVTPSGPVMVPLIDFVSHSFTPSCAVRDTGSEYVLYTVRPVRAGEELSINYGALSNEELLDDFGFTVDRNPHDTIKITVDNVLLYSARAVMGQNNESFGTPKVVEKGNVLNVGTSDGSNWVSDQPVHVKATAIESSPRSALSLAESVPFTENALQSWQKVWLQCMDMHDLGIQARELSVGNLPLYTASDGTLTFTSPASAQSKLSVDPRLLAFLRVLHSSRESDLLVHGYDPLSLQHIGSVLAAPAEAQVMRTLIGMLLLVLRSHGTTLAHDVALLTNGQLETSQENTVADGDGKNVGTSDHRTELTLGGTTQSKTGLLSALSGRGFFAEDALGRSLHCDAATLKGECRQVLRDIFRSPRHSNAGLSAAAPISKNAPELSTRPSAPPQARAQEALQVRVKQDATALVDTTLSSAIIRSAQRSVVDTDLLVLDRDTTTGSAGEMVNLTNLRQLGQKLPANVREALKYRIRRKKLLRDLVLQLTDLHELLCADPTGSDGVADLQLLLFGDSHGAENIRNRGGGTTSRTAQIRELLGEEKRSSPKDDALQKLKTLAIKWAAQAATENINL